MSVLEFHDAVVESISRTRNRVDARCSMVSVYDEDHQLLRQESGLLSIFGVAPRCIDEPKQGVEAPFDDGSILELGITKGLVTLMVEWESYSGLDGAVITDVRRVVTMTWTPDVGAPVSLL